MGSSSDKQQQNDDANQQIAQNKNTALTSLQQYMAANPGPVSGNSAPTPPPQYSGQAAGQNFGGAHLPAAMNGQPNPAQQPGPSDQLRRALAMQQPQRPGFQSPPQPGGPAMPGQMPPPSQVPPGLLGLLRQ